MGGEGQRFGRARGVRHDMLHQRRSHTLPGKIGVDKEMVNVSVWLTVGVACDDALAACHPGLELAQSFTPEATVVLDQLTRCPGGQLIRPIIRARQPMHTILKHSQQGSVVVRLGAVDGYHEVCTGRRLDAWAHHTASLYSSRQREVAMPILYSHTASVSVDQVIDVFQRSTLGRRRPVDRPDIFADMIRHADVLVTAWDDRQLVGLARTLTDFSYVAYLADLAVDEAWQRRGIGKQLIEHTRAHLGPECRIVLLAAPDANDYYPALGFEHNPRAWMLAGADSLRS